MGSWSLPNPDEGSTENLERIRSFLEVSATQLGYLYQEVRSVRANVTESVWSGPAHQTWDVNVGTYMDRVVVPTQGDHRGAARAIRVYLDAFAAIRGAMGKVRAKVTEIKDCGSGCEFLTWVNMGDWYGTYTVTGDPGRDYATPAVAFAFVNRPPGSSALPGEGAGAVAARQRQFETWADFLNAELAAEVTKMLAQADERTRIDNTLAEKLKKTLPDRWADKKAEARSLGIKNPAQMSDHHIAQAMAAKLRDYPEGELERFEGFYELYQGDPAMMAVFMSALGADGVTKVLPAWSEAAHDPGSYDGAVHLRQAFVTASHGWTDAEANAFVDDLFATIEGREPSCGFTFLFGGDYQGGDAAPSLVVGRRAADLIDKLAVAGARFEIGDRRLVWEDGQARGAGPLMQFDESTLYGGVLRSLSQYPNATADWLYRGATTSEGVMACPRVERWFAHDWSTDGYETPSAVLLNLQLASGSAHAPQVTGLALRAFVLGGTNQLVDPDKITPAAARNFAALIEALEPGVMRTILAPDSSDTGPGREDRDTGLMAVPGTNEPVAAVDKDQYNRLMQWALMQPEGRAMVDSYITYLSTSTLSDASYGTPGDRLKLIAYLDGLESGAMASADLTTATKLDDDARARIDALQTVVSCVPLPSVANKVATGATLYGIDYVQNLSIDQLTEWGSDQVGGRTSSVSDWSTRHRSLAIDDADAARETRLEEIEDHLTKTTETWRAQGVNVNERHLDPVGSALNDWSDGYGTGLRTAVAK